jgi:hypothetical protein
VFVRSQAEYIGALLLLASGQSVTDVARQLDVPRSTVEAWRTRPPRRRPVSLADHAGWRPASEASCSYLLGMYLGDGYLARDRRGVTASLRLSLDAAYEGVIDEAARAIARVMPGTPVGRMRRRTRCVVLQANHPAWPVAFPQHGRGKKHLRRIELAPWQAEITRRYPRELIRGLIHSDGCRSVNRFKTRLPSGRVAQYAYVRYFFSNLSEDIKDIFCTHCDALGIRWSRANPRYVSIHDRASVRLLDGFVGPKR